MGLRLKIVSGFVILSVMLTIAGVWSILEVRSIGKRVQSVLEENYESITASKAMREALENEDSAVLMFLLSNEEDGRKTLESADSSFLIAYNKASNNITIEGEREIVDKIKNQYAEFKSIWMNLLRYKSEERSYDWYQANVHSVFLEMIISVDKLLSLNDNAMYKTSVHVEDRSRRAVMPVIVAVIASIVFTLLFNYFINIYVITPIIQITDRVNDFTKMHKPFNYTVETKDELSKLNEAVYLLCSYAESDELKK